EEEGDDEADDDEDDMQWEDVLNVISAPEAVEAAGTACSGHSASSGMKKRGASAAERRIRLVTHCLHVQYLLFHGSIRNRWLCDPELQAILLSHLSPSLLVDVERFQKKQVVADPALKVLGSLMHWWKRRFTITRPGLRKNGYKPMSQFVIERDKVLADRLHGLSGAADGGFNFTTGRTDERGEPVYTIFKDDGERVENPQEFREMAKECRGSRDVGAMFFTALLRALGLEARMVFSLQPLGFGFTERESFSGKVRATVDSGGGRGGGGQGGERGRVEGGEEMVSEKKIEGNELPKIETTTIDRDLPCPIFWTEVYSPTTSTWITVDPIVLTVLGTTPDLLSKFEPKGKSAVESKQVIAYVLAYSDNGTAKDVTVRYLAKNAFPGKTKGFRILPSEVPVYDLEGQMVSTHKRDWFGNVMRGYQARGKLKLARDVKEDQELVGAPTVETKSFAGNGKESIGWYKDHPEYILERHLKRDEAIRPGKLHVKIFVSGKGEKAKEEKVYARQDMVSCKSVENWYRDGRVIKEGEQALKMVKPRAATLNRKREIEDARRDGETVLQGLYALEQTEIYMPPKIVNGEIPRNKYGNIDIYTQSMIPAGAVHLPLKGSARVAKKLKISYADAVTGFEFKHQRAAPYIEGIVIAAENEGLIRDAWEEEQVQRKIKEDGKREKVALTLWRRFIVGLRIVQRLHEVYEDDDGTEEANPFTAKRFRGKGKAVQDTHDEEEGGGGGFINNDASDDGGPGGFAKDNEDEDIEMGCGGGGFLLDVEEDPSEKVPVKKNSIPTQAMSMKEMLAQKQKAAQSIFDSEEEPEDAASSQEVKSTYFVGKTPPTTRKKAGKKAEKKK
ncbi:Rad4-domain-containing protein, partial [Choiromyces venosus 120613-1]